LAAEAFQGSVCLCSELLRLATRALEAEYRGVGRLCRSHIFARGFAELLGRLGDIEDVIDHWKARPSASPNAVRLASCAEWRWRSSHRDDRRGEQRRCFRAMDELQLFAGDLPPFAFEIEHWPAMSQRLPAAVASSVTKARTS
jgi:hypothetical protein